MDLQEYPLLVVGAGIAIVGLIFWYVATEVDRRKRNVGTLAIGIVIALCVAAIYPASEKLKGGIDLIGGSSFVVEIKPGTNLNNQEIPVTPESVQQAIATLSDRLSSSGMTDNLMQPLGDNRIIFEMPGVGDDRRAEIREIIERTARLELKEVHPQSDRLIGAIIAGAQLPPPGYKVYQLPDLDKEGKRIGESPILLNRRNIVGGDAVKTARATGRIGEIAVLLTKNGGERVRNSTGKMEHKKDRMAVVLDDEALIAPTVNSRLSREFQITGLDSKQEVRRVVFALNNPLKNPLNILSERNVSARYGQDVVRQGITAAVTGLALTLLFILIYYRFAGMVALAGLAINMLILFGAMAMFGATFTLPGIAGIILTIGVAVDANVLIYERLREEMAAGKSLKNALKAAYEKAFSAIFDANITTLLTAIILLWRASDQMKGFAITLTIGILSSMFAALLVTRVLFFWGRDTGVMKDKLSFMNLIPEKTIQFMQMRKPAFMLSAVLFIGSLVVMGTKRESALGIDFLGGSIVTVQLEAGQQLSAETVKEAINDLTLTKNPTVQLETVPNSDGGIISIKCDTADLQQIKTEIRKDIGILGEMNAEGIHNLKIDDNTISASLGSEFLKNSLWALGLGLFAVLIYISLRFEFSFAVGAFAALFHDIVICIGVVMLVGTELSLIHVGAFLTIAGYSINDTIVVFDRMRESLRNKRGNVIDVMNAAINATLSRTILTSVTTFVAVLVLYIFGGAALKDFSFAIMIGVLIGTYSSIFIAAPVVYIWSKARGTNLRKELLDADLDMATQLQDKPAE